MTGFIGTLVPSSGGINTLAIKTVFKISRFEELKREFIQLEALDINAKEAQIQTRPRENSLFKASRFLVPGAAVCVVRRTSTELHKLQCLKWKLAIPGPTQSACHWRMVRLFF